MYAERLGQFGESHALHRGLSAVVWDLVPVILLLLLCCISISIILVNCRIQ